MNFDFNSLVENPGTEEIEFDTPQIKYTVLFRIKYHKSSPSWDQEVIVKDPSINMDKLPSELYKHFYSFRVIALVKDSEGVRKLTKKYFDKDNNHLRCYGKIVEEIDNILDVENMLYNGWEFVK